MSDENEITTSDEDIFKAQDLMGRGHSQLKQNKFDDAVRSFSEAHKILPDGYLSRECVIYSLYAKFRSAVGSGNKDAIEESFQKLGKWAVEYKDMKAAHLLLGHAYRAVGNNTESINCYRNALKLDENYDEARHALDAAGRDSGVVHQDPKKEEEAYSRKQKMAWVAIIVLFAISGVINYQYWFAGPDVKELDVSTISHILPAEKILGGEKSITVQVKDGYEPKLEQPPAGMENLGPRMLAQQAWDAQCQKVLKFFEPDGVQIVVLSDSKQGLNALCMGAMDLAAQQQ